MTEALTTAATAVVGLLKSSPNSPTHSASSTPAPNSSALSPAKRAHVSGQYLEQLAKLKNLQELGVLSLEEFNEQKEFALNIRKLQ